MARAPKAKTEAEKPVANDNDNERIMNPGRVKGTIQLPNGSVLINK